MLRRSSLFEVLTNRMTVMKKAAGRVLKDILDYKTVILIVAIYYILMHVFFHAFCPLVLITGLPCAGCGMTRAVFFMLTGQFARSFRLHPIALPILLFAAYCFYYRYFLGRKIKGFALGIGVLTVLLVGCYLYGMCTFFPDKTPYVYTAGSLFENIIPNYREYLRIIMNIC